MRWRWERLFSRSISTQALTPVMDVSLGRWWPTSASTRERRTLVSHLERKPSHRRICFSGNSSDTLHLNLSVFPEGPALTKEDKEALRQKELKQMKAKYGLQVSVRSSRHVKPLILLHAAIHLCVFCKQSNEETKALKNPRYLDRAESRRQTVGSEGVFQRDDAPASVHK